MLTVMTLSRAQRVGYWTALLLFAAGMLVTGMYYLTESPHMVREFSRLGYPLYFMKLLGVGKVLGVLAIVFTKSPAIKEWCYAGFTISLIAAAVSHVCMEDPVNKVIIPLLFLVALGVCYKLEHPKHHLK